MSTLPLSYTFGGFGSYEALRNRMIEKVENPKLFGGDPQAPKLVLGHVTLGFGYDLAARKSTPEKILADLAAAGIQLTIKQIVAVLFYGETAQDNIRHYLDDLAAFGTRVTPDDRDFVDKLGASDRTDEGLLKHLAGLAITKPQGDVLLSAVVEEKQALFDAFLLDPENAIPQDVRDQLKMRSDQRAVLVDMFYQLADFFGPQLLQALRAGAAAAAALEIAFLSNKKPRETPGIDARNFARAETFFGGTFAPRTKEEAEAFLHAIAARSDALALALAKRQGDPNLEQVYFDRLNAVVKVSLRRFGLDTTLTLQADGSFKVGSEVPLNALARAFGLSPLALALANSERFPTPPDGSTKFPKDKLLHLPSERERKALERSGIAVTSTAPAAPLTPEAYDALRKEYQKNLAHPPQSPPKPVTPRRGHASLEGDELLGQFSPASLEIAETLGQRFSPTLDPAVVTRYLPELEALPILGPAVDSRELGTAVGFGSAPEPAWLPVPVSRGLWREDRFQLNLVAPPPRAFDRAELQRIEAAIERCLAQAKRLDREVDSWIERRNAARRYRSFY